MSKHRDGAGNVGNVNYLPPRGGAGGGKPGSGLPPPVSKDDGPKDEPVAVAVGDGSGNQVGARRFGHAAKKHRHRATGKRVANLPQRIKNNVPARKFVFKPTCKSIE